MKSLPAKRGCRQTRQTRYARIQKFPQVALRSRRARPLDRHGERQLAHRWAALRAKPSACPVDVRNQIQLLGDPDQRPDVADPARAHRTRGTQIRHRWERSRAQHNLARDGATSIRIPHRLSCDTVAMAVHLAFEHMHILSCSISRTANQAIFIISGAFRLRQPPRDLQVCEGRASPLVPSPCSSAVLLSACRGMAKRPGPC